MGPMLGHTLRGRKCPQRPGSRLNSSFTHQSPAHAPPEAAAAQGNRATMDFTGLTARALGTVGPPGLRGPDGHCRESPDLSPGEPSPGGEVGLEGEPQRRTHLSLPAAQVGMVGQEDMGLNRGIIGA